MKMFKVTIKIEGLGGSVRETVHTFRCRTESAAVKRAYAIIGNQSGEIVKIEVSGEFYHSDLLGDVTIPE